MQYERFSSFGRYYDYLLCFYRIPHICVDFRSKGRKRMYRRSLPTANRVPKMKQNITLLQMPPQKPALEVLPCAIREVIGRYHGQISLAEAVGVLEIVKLELIKEHS